MIIYLNKLMVQNLQLKLLVGLFLHINMHCSVVIQILINGTMEVSEMRSQVMLKKALKYLLAKVHALLVIQSVKITLYLRMKNFITPALDLQHQCM